MSWWQDDLPCALVVEEAVRALLKLFRDILGLLVTLEPRLVLLVESPALVLERLGSEVLLRRSLLVVKDVEQSVRVNARVKPGVIEDG